MFECRKHVGAAEELEIRIRTVCADTFEQVLKTDHLKQFIGFRCLCTYLDVPFFASLYWLDFDHGKFLACISRAVLRGRNAIFLGHVTAVRGGAGAGIKDPPCGRGLRSGKTTDG